MDSDDFVLRKKGMTIKVFNNNVDGAIAQLKRRMNSEGINKELRKRKHYTPPSIIRRQKMAEAKLRWKKKYAQIMELDLPKKKKTKKDFKTVNRTPINQDNLQSST
jgi:small subunit ribosomal protein S21